MLKRDKASEETLLPAFSLSLDERFGASEDPYEAKARMDALIKYVQYRKLCGDVIETELVARMAAEAALYLREAIYAFIDTSSPELAALTDPKLVRGYLREKLPPLFNDLESKWLPPSINNRLPAAS